jgi:hypothetical protein
MEATGFRFLPSEPDSIPSARLHCTVKSRWNMNTSQAEFATETVVFESIWKELATSSNKKQCRMDRAGEVQVHL